MLAVRIRDPDLRSVPVAAHEGDEAPIRRPSSLASVCDQSAWCFTGEVDDVNLATLADSVAFVDGVEKLRRVRGPRDVARRLDRKVRRVAGRNVEQVERAGPRIS